jgi:hypothetical protein
MLTTPESIRTLQRKLYRKAKQDEGVCPAVKNIGKPCAGKPHARFDEGGQVKACSLLYPEFRTEKYSRTYQPESGNHQKRIS